MTAFQISDNKLLKIGWMSDCEGLIFTPAKPELKGTSNFEHRMLGRRR